jgi:DNA-binding transcriptional LysR family regulator
MEDELGIELFIREKKAVRLTPAGEVLAEGFKQLSADYQALVDKANAMHMGFSGNVNLGIVEGQLVCPPVSTALILIHDKYPDVRVNLTKHTMSGLRKSLANGDIDLAFTAQFDLRSDEELESEIVGKVSTYLVVPKSHPLVGKENLKLSDFKNSTFLSLSEDESPYIARNNASLYGMRTLEAPNIGTLGLWLEAGYGIFPLNGNHQLRNNPNLAFIPMPELGETNEVIVWKRDNKNPALAMLVEQFRQCVKDKEKAK